MGVPLPPLSVRPQHQDEKHESPASQAKISALNDASRAATRLDATTLDRHALEAAEA